MCRCSFLRLFASSCTLWLSDILSALCMLCDIMFAAICFCRTALTKFTVRNFFFNSTIFWFIVDSTVFSFSLRLISNSPTTLRLGLGKEEEEEMEMRMKLGARETLREKRREVGAHTVILCHRRCTIASFCSTVSQMHSNMSLKFAFFKCVIPVI